MEHAGSVDNQQRSCHCSFCSSIKSPKANNPTFPRYGSNRLLAIYFTVELFVGNRLARMRKWESSAAPKLISSLRWLSVMQNGCASRWRYSWAFVGTLCATLSMVPTTRAEVEIHTTEGQILTGEVDLRTTANHLWVRQGSDRVLLATPVRWTTIASASVDGQPIDVDELANSSAELATEARLGYPVKTLQSPPLHHPADLVEPVGRVTSLEVEAMLVNLDRDVEPDGYELSIAVVDEFGHEVPVKGSLYVRLLGERNVHHTGRIRFEVFETWNQPVALHHFADGVAMYVLPFRAFNPEFDDELRPDAQIDVRLGVFGEGNFAATTPVPLWNFGPFRDRLQMFEGSRFYRNELTGRVRHTNDDPPGVYRRTWRHRQ